MLTKREKLSVMKDVLQGLAVIVIIVLLIGGLVLLIGSVIQQTAQDNQMRAACWSEYGNTQVESIPARCRHYMGFTK